MNSVAFYTLGCKVNQYETQAMIEVFESSGYKVVEYYEFANIYVINSCTVTNLAARKTRQFIRRTKKNNPDAIIAVVGCYPQTSTKEVMNIKEVDLIIGTDQKSKIVEFCEEARKNNRKINKVTSIEDVDKFEELKINNIHAKTRAFIKIQDGCNQFCSYCIIPYARGRVRSRKIENIISEIRKLAENGFKEIVLTGIHIASYGKDLKGLQLLDVIEKANKVDGIKRIRLGSLEPTIINEEFMERYKNQSKTCNHFHLSLQSGSNTVLKRMNRKYTVEEYSDKVDIIRKYMPKSSITTDIIVGFPGETDLEFTETCEFVNKIGFSKVHVFKYSPREGTKAASYKNQVHGNVKSLRSSKLIDIAEKNALTFNKSFIGSTMDVLFEEKSKLNNEYYEGYTTNYLRVTALTDKSPEGKILPVRINAINNEVLQGKIVLK